MFHGYNILSHALPRFCTMTRGSHKKLVACFILGEVVGDSVGAGRHTGERHTGERAVPRVSRGDCAASPLRARV